ncbi:MAG: hypothetical protein IJY94_03185 [Clostridia bacterium]|nr:hypothetical protein [Clostridia bacterium]
MKFSYEYRVSSQDIDLNGIASATSIMRYMQEAANLQHEEFGPTLDALRKSGKAFILSRVALDICKPLYAQDKITVTTWLNDARGFGYNRSTVIERNGEKIASMAAFWGAMDIEKRQPIKVDEIKLGFGTDEEKLETVSPMRFRTNGVELTELGGYKVVYGDCDENVHLNNTNYPRIFCGFIPNMLGKRVTNLSINYQKEARLGASFKVCSAESDGVLFFKTVLDDGNVGSEARIVLGDIE